MYKKKSGNQNDYKRWLFLAIFFLGLGFNKQLDLQTIISDIGRYIALKFELMEQRHIFKRAFIVALALGLAGFIYLLKGKIKAFAQAHPSISLGIASIVLFVFCRALSFHIFSIPFNEFLARLHVYAIWEISGLIFILFFLLKLLKKKAST